MIQRGGVSPRPTFRKVQALEEVLNPKGDKNENENRMCLLWGAGGNYPPSHFT